MVGEIDHGAQVEVLLRVVENLFEDVIGVEHAVRIRRRARHRGVARRRFELRPCVRVAVVVVDVTAHEMQDDEVVRVRVDARQIREEFFVVFRRKGIGVIRPLRLVRGLCDHRDRAVKLPVAPLIAEPVGLVADFFRNVENRCGFEELLVVVLALFGERALKDGDGLRPRGIGVLVEDEAGIGGHLFHPRRIVVREARRINVHVVA